MTIAAAIVLLAAAAPAMAEIGPAQRCRADLDFLPGFLLENDSGARANAEAKGEEHMASALAKAQADASAVASDEACIAVLNSYLHAYRAGHLWVSALAGGPDQPGAAPLPPSFKVLSADTVLIQLPSFDPAFQAPVAKLIAQLTPEILKHRNLIIDVRGNGGGTDSVYTPLWRFIRTNQIHQVTAEFLATPDNAAAGERLIPTLGPSCPECAAALTDMSRRMRAAPPGSYLPMGEEGIDRPAASDVTRNPARVAILIDHKCGSSCEQFVLDARQEYKVKLFGRPTFGALDYSNLRPTPLPSGLRQVFRATSRSLRLPELPIDGIGVQPDQLLKEPADKAAFDAEIDQVRAVVESP